MSPSLLVIEGFAPYAISSATMSFILRPAATCSGVFPACTVDQRVVNITGSSYVSTCIYDCVCGRGVDVGGWMCGCGWVWVGGWLCCVCWCEHPGGTHTCVHTYIHVKLQTHSCTTSCIHLHAYKHIRMYTHCIPLLQRTTLQSPQWVVPE